MNQRLIKRVERIERRLHAYRRNSANGYDYDNVDGIILIPEILNAARQKLAEAAHTGQAPAEHTPERLEQFRRRGRELRRVIEARQRLRRLLHPKRR